MFTKYIYFITISAKIYYLVYPHLFFSFEAKLHITTQVFFAVTCDKWQYCLNVSEMVTFLFISGYGDSAGK